MPPKIVSHRLRKNRKIYGFSQRGAARLLGVTPTQLMEWERGKRMPDTRNLFKLVALYKTLGEDLYYELRHDALNQVESNKLKYGMFGTGEPP
jgi:transcriptional regulator with XRE-family HTH domain